MTGLVINVCIIGLFAIFALISLIDAKFVRQNDYFIWNVIIFAAFEVSDIFLDALFSIVLSRYYLINGGSTQFIIAMIGSYLFILLPIIFSIYQLWNKIQKSWIKDDNLRIWLAEHGKVLYILSIICGSSYTAISMVNCGALKLDIFSMGLTKYERLQFNTKRIFGIILFEVECI